MKTINDPEGGDGLVLLKLSFYIDNKKELE